MEFIITDYIPAEFHNTSRVWIYQSNRQFPGNEILQLEEMMTQFVADWKSHGAEVKGFANLLFNQFIVIMADESATGVSGCSTDSSVRMIKAIEQKFNVLLFERQTLAFIIKEKIELLSLSQIENAIEDNIINADTLYFNNIVQTKEELLNNWIIPVKKSWLAKRYNLPATVN